MVTYLFNEIIIRYLRSLPNKDYFGKILVDCYCLTDNYCNSWNTLGDKLLQQAV